MRDAWQRYWSARSPRERRLIASGAGFLAVAFLYAYLWLPLARDRERLMSDLPRLRAQAQQMRSDAAAITGTRARTSLRPQSASGDLKTALAAFSAAQKNRPAPQVVAEGDARTRVTFAAVRADEWITLIGALALEQRMRVESARIEVLDEPGMIKASAVLYAGS